MVSGASSSSAEPKLTIQSFHQRSSLVSIKLSTSNFPSLEIPNVTFD